MQSDKDPIEERPRQGGKPAGQREKCPRQVYTSAEIAKSSLERLKVLGIHGRIYRCTDCGMIHVDEVRTQPAPAERYIYPPKKP